jgi:hypothetical protein
MFDNKQIHIKGVDGKLLSIMDFKEMADSKSDDFSVFGRHVQPSRHRSMPSLFNASLYLTLPEKKLYCTIGCSQYPLEIFKSLPNLQIHDLFDLCYAINGMSISPGFINQIIRYCGIEAIREIVINTASTKQTSDRFIAKALYNSNRADKIKREKLTKFTY